MKRKWIALLVILALALVPGCTLNAAFVRAVDAHTSVILPRYETYVANDPALDVKSREIRIRAAESLQRLIQAAKEEVRSDATD